MLNVELIQGYIFIIAEVTMFLSFFNQHKRGTLISTLTQMYCNLCNGKEKSSIILFHGQKYLPITVRCSPYPYFVPFEF